MRQEGFLKPSGEVHPVADLFPMMSDEELADLAADIKANGLLYPIVLDADGTLIDGRNRLRACQMVKVEPTFEPLNGRDPVALILSANVERRQLSKGQAAMAVAQARVLDSSTSQAGAARAANVNRGRLFQAEDVVRYTPELAREVMAGTLGLDAAYETAKRVKADAMTREEAAKQRERELANLRREAPELADLVVEGTLTLEGAKAELAQRREEQRLARLTATKNLHTALMFIDPWNQNVGARAENTASLLEPSMLGADADFSPERLRRCAEALDALAVVLEGVNLVA